jgi:hypothetical protein
VTSPLLLFILFIILTMRACRQRLRIQNAVVGKWQLDNVIVKAPTSKTSLSQDKQHAPVENAPPAHVPVLTYHPPSPTSWKTTDNTCRLPLKMLLSMVPRVPVE